MIRSKAADDVNGRPGARVCPRPADRMDPMSDGMQIPLLERALGGLLPGHAYLFHGVSGVGKTVLGLQVARHWTEGGRRVLYLTTDPPENLLEQASLLGLSLQRIWEQHDLVLCSYGAGVAAQVRVHGMRAFLEHLHAAGGPGANAIILDPVTPIFDAFSNSSVIERDVRLLCEALRDWNWSTVFLADTTDLRQRPGLRESLAARCSGVLELCTSRGRSNPAESPFLLKIERARQVTPAGAIVPYAIALEAGLIPVPVPVEDEQAGSEAQRARLPRVLVASPENLDLDPLVRLLRRTMDVETVADGASALSRAATWNPDVLLVQTELPRLSGFAVTRALRQGRYTLPVILLTAGGRRRSDRVRALLSGATDLVQSPFDLREVAARIRMASRMRVAALETGVEQHLLEVLAAQAQDNVLDVPAFLEALGIALRAAARFSSPVSLVTFSLHAPAVEPPSEEAWSRFRRILQQDIRAGDLICFPDAWRVATLLCHENQGGAAAFTERVADLARQDLAAGTLLETGWRIDTASLTIDAPAFETADVRGLLDEAFAEARFFLGEPEAGDELRMTGTDGR
jgi:CheY-like chemotaxis protein